MAHRWPTWRAVRVWERNLAVFRKYSLPSLIGPSIGEPLLYLLGLGFGLGTLGAIALTTGHLPAALVCLAVAGASAGFLRHNFPAASIFMGDAGGLFLGYLSGSLSVLLCGVLGQAAGGGEVSGYPLRG